MATHSVAILLQRPYLTTPSPPGAVNKQKVSGIIKLRREYFGGTGRVSGTTKIDGTPDFPTSCRVRLFRDIDAVCVDEVWSDADGNYEFEFIDASVKYSVVAYDHEHNFRAVIADNITPDPM